MLGPQTQNKLARLFRTLAKGEQDIEEARQSLARNPTFESYTAFKRIDRHSDNALSMSEFTDFLKENYVLASDKEIRALFSAYSSTGGVRLSYNDFQRLILPKNNNDLRNKCLGRKVQAISSDEILPEDLEKALSTLVQSEINLLMKVEDIKEDLSIKADFNLMDAFKTLDATQQGTLSVEAIYTFLDRTQPVTKADVEAVFVRFDKDKDHLLSYTEFAEIVQPVSPNYRVALRSPSPKRRPESPVNRSPRKEASPVRSPRGLGLSGSFVKSPVSSPVKKYQTDLEYRDYLRETARTANESRVTEARSPLATSTSFFKDSPIKKTYDLKQSSILSPRSLLFSSPLKTVDTAKSLYNPTPLLEQSKVSVQVQSPSVSPRKRVATSDTVGFEELGNAEKKQLARFLKEELDFDRSLEGIKKELALVKGYNAHNIFRIFDVEGKGYISRGQLETGLQTINILPSKNELYLTMRRLDKDDDGLIRFAEFKEEIEPKNQAHKAISSTEKKDEEVSFEVRRVLRKLLNKMITNETSCDELRQALGKQTYFTIFEAFTNLRKNVRGWITAQSIKDLLVEQGIYASEEDAEILLVRYDRNKDKKVSYSEFVDEITQKLPVSV